MPLVIDMPKERAQGYQMGARMSGLVGEVVVASALLHDRAVGGRVRACWAGRHTGLGCRRQGRGRWCGSLQLAQGRGAGPRCPVDGWELDPVGPSGTPACPGGGPAPRHRRRGGRHPVCRRQDATSAAFGAREPPPPATTHSPAAPGFLSACVAEEDDMAGREVPALLTSGALEGGRNPLSLPTDWRTRVPTGLVREIGPGMLAARATAPCTVPRVAGRGIVLAPGAAAPGRRIPPLAPAAPMSLSVSRRPGLAAAFCTGIRPGCRPLPMPPMPLTFKSPMPPATPSGSASLRSRRRGQGR